MSQTGKFIQTGSSLGIARGRGEGERLVTADGYRVSFKGDGNVSEVDGGDVGTTV